MIGAVVMVLSVGNEQGPGTPLFSVGLVVAALGLGGLGYVALRRAEGRARLYEQEQRDKRSVDQAFAEAKDLTELLRLNRQQMDAYEKLTRRQAESSYRLSHVALAAGLAVVIVGAAVAIGVPPFRRTGLGFRAVLLDFLIWVCEPRSGEARTGVDESSVLVVGG